VATIWLSGSEKIDSTIVIMAEPNESIELANYLTSMASRNQAITNPFRMSWRGTSIGMNRCQRLVNCLLLCSANRQAKAHTFA